jgi:hypothetical protein
MHLFPPVGRKIRTSVTPASFSGFASLLGDRESKTRRIASEAGVEWAKSKSPITASLLAQSTELVQYEWESRGRHGVSKMGKTPKELRGARLFLDLRDVLFALFRRVHVANEENCIRSCLIALRMRANLAAATFILENQPGARPSNERFARDLSPNASNWQLGRPPGCRNLRGVINGDKNFVGVGAPEFICVVHIKSGGTQ